MSPNYIQILIGIIIIIVAFKLLKKTIKVVVYILAIAYLAINVVGIDKCLDIIHKIFS